MRYGIIGAVFLSVIFIGIYAYFYLKRTAEFWHVNREKKIVKLIFAVISFFIAFIGISIWQIGAVIVLHWLAFSAIMDGIQLVRKKFRNRNDSKLWEILYQSGTVPILITVIVLLFGHWNMLHIVEKDYTVETDKLIREEGYQVLLISDLHLGTTLNMRQLEKICQNMEEVKPDMVILCGDIADENTKKEELERGISILSSITSEFGTYYVFGNHDRGSYRANTDFTEKLLQETLIKNGIHILRDTNIQLNSEFTIVGRDDRSVSKYESRASQETLLSKVDKNSFILLADHQPVELQQNDENEVDLQVSGHTHGGQIFPVGILSDWLGFGELNYGYEKMNHMQVIVTSGIGGWGYSIRTGHHSEYAVINIIKR